MNNTSLGWPSLFVILSLAPSICASAANDQRAPNRSPTPAISIKIDEAMSTEGPVEQIDLEEALKLALEGNIDLALAKSEEVLAEVRVSGGKSSFLPSAEVDAGFARVDGTVQGSFGDFRDIDARSHRVGIGLTYGLNIGQQVKELAALRAQMDAAVFNSLAAEQRLILRVAELYENLVLSKVGVNIADLLVADAESFEHIARVRAEAGVGRGSDVARAQTSVASSKSRLEEVREVWRQTSVRLAVVLRKDPRVLLDPKDAELEQWQIADEQERAVDPSAARNRPDVEAARHDAGAAADRLQAARWDLYGPKLTAEARLSGVGGRGERAVRDRVENLSDAIGGFARGINNWRNVFAENSTTPISTPAGSIAETFYDYRDLFRDSGQDIDLERRENFAVGLAWSFSFSKWNRIRELKVQQSRAQLHAEQLEERAAGEVRSAQLALKSTSKQIGFALDELEAAETNHRIAVARFREGTAIALEVLDAQQVVAQARLNLARHLTNQNLAQARLLTATGTIDSEHFGAIQAP